MKIVLFFLLASSMALAQSSARPAAASTPNSTQASAASGSISPDVQALNQLIIQVQTSADKSDADLSRLRIDKWKTEAAGKQDATATTASIRRNLTNAVPDLLQRLQASPGSLNANFRLYRNLNALYDTFSSLVESAGAFGSKDQYEPLAADIAQLDHLRHQLAERVDQLAGASDAELVRLRSQVATAAGAKPALPSKIVVDDEKPKPKVKKKPKPAPQTQPQTQTPQN
jgi:hypothetical protein